MGCILISVVAVHKMYSNDIVNFQESTTILNACTKKSGNLLKASRTSLHPSRRSPLQLDRSIDVSEFDLPVLLLRSLSS